MKKVIETQNAPAPVGPYSQAIEVDGTLYCSGQIPLVPETGEVLTGDIQEQARQVMKNAEAVLREADYSWRDVIKATIFLTDLNDFNAVNEIYASHLAEPFPARSCIQVAALPKGVNVEVELIAKKA